MADLRVRNLEDWVVAELRARAKRHGKSLEGEPGCCAQYDVPLITADKLFRDRAAPFDQRVTLLAGYEAH